jgi:transposase-like protein
VDGQRVRVQTPRVSTPWLPDTPRHRHRTVVWLRLLVDEHGTPWFTWEELSVIVGRANRQAASQHLEDVRPCGADVRALVLRKRKVDAAGVEAVWPERLKTPLAGPAALAPRVKAQVGRHDLSAATIPRALAQIACVPVLRALRRQFEAGQVQDQEAWLWTERLERQASPAAPSAGGRVPSAEHGRRLADPTALAALVTPDLPLTQVPDSRGGLTVRMTLCYGHGPRSVLGRWCGVHQPTSRRWVGGWALALGPIVSQWIVERIQAKLVDVDEKWLTSRGRGHDWFVGLAVATELPVLALLLPSRSQWACRWLGRQLRQLKHVPRVLITDGLPAYAYVLPGAQHVWCRVHPQQGVTPWWKPQFTTAAEIDARKPAMKQVLQTQDKRTVRRRLARLKAQATAWGMTPWVSRVEAKWPGLIGTVGRGRLPSTTHAIERFFRAFQRFYVTRGGVHSVLSATRQLRLFVVV